MNICIRILQICLLVMLANGYLEDVHLTCDLDLKERVLGDRCQSILLQRYEKKAGYLLETESLHNLTNAQVIYRDYDDLQCDDGVFGMLHPYTLYYKFKLHRCYNHGTKELFLSCLSRKRNQIAQELLANPRKYIQWITSMSIGKDPDVHN